MATTQPSGAIRRLESGQVTDAVLSPDSKTVYVTAGKDVLAYSLTTGAQTGRWTIGSNLGALDVTADGTALVVVERTSGAVSGAGTSAYTVDQSVYKLDLASGTATTFTRATPGGSAYRDVVALADGTVLLSEGYYTYSRTLTALDPRAGTFANGPAISYGETLSTNARHDRVLVSTTSGYGFYSLYNATTGAVVSATSDSYPGMAQAISADGSKVATSSLLRLFDSSLHQTANLQSRYLALGGATGVAFSPDGGTFYAADPESRAVFAFDSVSGDVKGVYPIGATVKDIYNERLGGTLLASADGHYLTVLGSGSVQVIDLTTVVSVGGTTGSDTIVGDGTMMRLFGFDGNDTLYSGGTTNIALFGGAGDDTYYLDTYASVNEYAGEGFDTVYSSVDVGGYLANVERIVLTGGTGRYASGDDYAQEIIGNSADNVLDGRGGDDVLVGNDGNDTLIGGAGADRMSGGAGDDTYDVDDVDDRVIESVGQGTDLVYAAVDYVLPDNVENLTLSFYSNPYTNRYATLGRGNALDNVLIGNGRDNTLYGEGGDDTLSGGDGVDLLYGGEGRDTYRDTAAGLSGDTIGSRIGRGDRIVISDAWIGSFSFSVDGDRLTYSGGSVTLAGGRDGKLVAHAAAGGGVELSIAAAPARHDFDGDGRSDILWRNLDGTLSNWLGRANGGFAANDSAALTRVGNDWHVAASSDVNGDGRVDLVWRSDSGGFSTWLATASGGFVANDAAALTNVARSWQIAGAGDFNGDGRGDVLWRNADGTLSNWLGRADGGFTPNDGAALSRVDPQWRVVGVGDFNGDGRSDILWRHADGSLSDWLGRPDGGFNGNDAAARSQVSNDWTVVGIGDVNGDGRDDLIWRNADGSLSDWLGRADGGFKGNDAAAFVGRVSTSWSIVDTGDYNGDGRDDILWRNQDGALSDWLGQTDGSFVANDGNAFSTVPVSWQVQGMLHMA